LESDISWTPQKWAVLEGIAAKYGLKIACGLYVHLKDSLGREVASIQDISFENSIYIQASHERAEELLEEIGSRLFGASSL
jgi:hypothetical protein